MVLKGIDVLMMVLLLVASVFIGIYSFKKVTNNKDFNIANRSLGLIVSFATISATMTGGTTVLAQAGMAYNLGVSSLWMTISWSIGWSVLALMSQKVHNTGADSLPNIFERRFGPDTAKLSGLVTMVYVVGTTAAQLAATGKLIQLVFGNTLTFTQATIIGAVIITVITVLGGLYAVAYNDTLHFFILALALGIFVPIITINNLEGGFNAIKATLEPEFFNIMNGMSFSAALAMTLAYAFSATSNASLIQRTLAAKDAKTASRSHWYAMIWYFIVSGTILVSVLAGKILIPDLGSPETIVAALVVKYFPVGLVGLTMAALLAVVISTADSYLLIAGTTTANDVIAIFKSDLTDKQRLVISRIATFVWGGLALLFAVKFKMVLFLFSKTAALYAAGMFFPLIFTIYVNKATKKGIMAGMLSGMIVSLVWLILGSPFGLNSILIGGPVSGIATYFVSMSTFKENGENKLSNDAV